MQRIERGRGGFQRSASRPAPCTTALRDLKAAVYVSDDEPPLPFDIHPAAPARADIWNLVTTAGHLDIVFRPAEGQGRAAGSPAVA